MVYVDSLLWFFFSVFIFSFEHGRVKFRSLETTSLWDRPKSQGEQNLCETSL